jgi:hypothetical protein
MKKHIFNNCLMAVASAILLVSCNSGKEKEAEEKPADSTAVKKEIPAGPSHLLLVRHKVADFAKWFPGYEAHDSARLANGVHSYVISRSLDDSNMVLIAMKVDDVDKAKAFSTSADLKEVMKKVGVISAPVADIVEVVFNDATDIQEPNRMMITQKVKDFDAWKKAFDSHKQARTDAGLTDRVVATSVNDKNTVTVVVAVSDLAKAKAFSQSKDLRDKMKEAGVEGAPDIVFFRIVKKY